MDAEGRWKAFWAQIDERTLSILLENQFTLFLTLILSCDKDEVTNALPKWKCILAQLRSLSYVWVKPFQGKQAHTKPIRSFVSPVFLKSICRNALMNILSLKY